MASVEDITGEVSNANLQLEFMRPAVNSGANAIERAVNTEGLQDMYRQSISAAETLQKVPGTAEHALGNAMTASVILDGVSNGTNNNELIEATRAVGSLVPAADAVFDWSLAAEIAANEYVEAMSIALKAGKALLELAQQGRTLAEKAEQLRQAGLENTAVYISQHR